MCIWINAFNVNVLSSLLVFMPNGSMGTIILKTLLQAKNCCL